MNITTRIPTTLTDGATAPVRAHAHDAGADLAMLATEDGAESVTLQPGETALIRTGVSVALPERTVLLLFPRSGLGIKHNITLQNCVGVVDAGYRNEIKVGLINHGNQAFTINKGDRIAQAVVTPFIPTEFTPVDELPQSSDGRGMDGFGSTGK